MRSATEFENLLALATVESLAGAMPESVVAVSIQASEANERLDVFIASTAPLDDAEFDEDLRADIDALVFGVSTQIHHWVCSDWLRGWPGLGRRRVYQRKHPEIRDPMPTDIEYENRLVLATIQALLGMVPACVTAISLVADRNDESLDVFLASTGRFDFDDFDEDLTGEIDALTDGRLLIRIHHWIGRDPVSGWPGLDKRKIYVRDMSTDRS